MADTAWMEYAECFGEDVNLFFPHENGDEYRKAMLICQRCDVREACLEYAIDTREIYGIWGGTGQRERKRMIRDRYVKKNTKRKCDVA